MSFRVGVSTTQLCRHLLFGGVVTFELFVVTFGWSMSSPSLMPTERDDIAVPLPLTIGGDHTGVVTVWVDKLTNDLVGQLLALFR